MSTLTITQLHTAVNSSTPQQISSFFYTSTLFQKFLIHKFIDSLPSQPLKTSQIFKEFATFTPNIQSTHPIPNPQNTPIIQTQPSSKTNQNPPKKQNKPPFLPPIQSQSILHKIPFDIYRYITYDFLRGRDDITIVSRYFYTLKHKLRQECIFDTNNFEL